MWIFTKHGFLSIVEPYKELQPNNLLVRSRVKGDIENHFPNAKVLCTPDRDYLYRTVVPRLDVSDVIAEAVKNIDYNNFKDSIRDSITRKMHYGVVWEDMCALQQNMRDGNDDCGRGKDRTSTATAKPKRAIRPSD